MQLRQIRAYHQLTKHLPTRYSPGPGYLDWDNQPDPFRRWSGSRVVELPYVSDAHTIPFARLHKLRAVEPRLLTLESVGLFLELALGLSAWKQFEETRWALRNNPSSGNLHPTEGYIVLPPLEGVSACAGMYHYAPREHALEERKQLSERAWSKLIGGRPTGWFLAGLSSVHWREAWKYGERAYRYCQHDTGHALGAMRFSAAALGWRLKYLPELSDTDVAVLLGLDRNEDFHDAEIEYPDLVALVGPGPQAITGQAAGSDDIDLVRSGPWHGRANELSPLHHEWPEIDEVARAAAKPRTVAPLVQSSANPVIRSREIEPPDTLSSTTAVIRRRRSAVDMDGTTTISRDVFFRMLARTMPDPRVVPWDGFELPARILLAVFVHRVVGLEPGLYVLMRDRSRVNAFREVCRADFAWNAVADELPLFALKLSDLRETAGYISCTQEIASDGAFSLGMVADFQRTLSEEGPWAYRRLFWECGLIGQVLYLEAEVARVQATGIGCYFDDLLHACLGLDPDDDRWQSLYHFTVGGAVVDDRLATLPAYDHLPPHRRLQTSAGLG